MRCHCTALSPLLAHPPVPVACVSRHQGLIASRGLSSIPAYTPAEANELQVAVFAQACMQSVALPTGIA